MCLRWDGCQFHQRFKCNFLYECLWAAFFYLLFVFEFLVPIFHTKIAHVKHWWNWLKVRKATFKNSQISEVLCLICNQGLNSSEATVSICSSVLCSSPSNNEIRNIKFVTEVQLPPNGIEDQNKNDTEMDKYCGFR